MDYPVLPSRGTAGKVTKAPIFEANNGNNLSKFVATPSLSSSAQVSLQAQLLDRIPHLNQESVVDYKGDLEGHYRKASAYLMEIRRLEKELSLYARLFEEEYSRRCQVEFELAHAKQKITELESENHQLCLKVLNSGVKMLNIKDQDDAESGLEQRNIVTGVLDSK